MTANKQQSIRNKVKDNPITAFERSADVRVDSHAVLHIKRLVQSGAWLMQTKQQHKKKDHNAQKTWVRRQQRLSWISGPPAGSQSADTFQRFSMIRHAHDHSLFATMVIIIYPNT